MTPERFNKITSVLEKRQPDLTIITDEIHKQRNIAAIIRNCDAVGIDTIHCVMPDTGYQLYSGTAASAQKWVNVRHYGSIIEPVEALAAKGFQFLCADLAEDAVDYREVDYTVPTAIVMGAEVKGVSDIANQFATHRIVLPMLGMVESYNVSVANALILNEAQRQREQAGLYNQNRLEGDVYNDRFFRWAHPKIAKYCEDNELDFPPLREDGEIVDPSQWYASVRALGAP